jgi:hypothetical protein
VVKLLRVAGVSAGTMTSGGLVRVVAGWGVVTGRVVGVTVVVGVTFVGVVTFGGGVSLVGSDGLVVGVGLAGGVTVIAGATIPATPSAHNMAITPELMLVGFMVSASRSVNL